MDKIKILFVNYDSAGVNYFRTQTPAIKLDTNHSDKFEVDINPNIDLSPKQFDETIAYLRGFNIIHYHRTLHPDLNIMKRVADELRKTGTVLVVDIDDYWELDKTHPLYLTSMKHGLHLQIIENLKIADYVTTTTELFKQEIERVAKGVKVAVFENAVDPDLMEQFKDKKIPDPNGLVRIVYSAGSSHKYDVEILQGVFNTLNADPDVKGKFKIILAGWDTRGETTDVKFNDNFGKELQLRGLWDAKLVKSINNCDGDINLIKGVPPDLRAKYHGKVFSSSKRDIHDDESVYLEYEKVLTDNYNIIPDKEYVDYLKTIKQEPFSRESNYARRWTRKANIYAEVLNECDISLAPLANHKFNSMKSNLKQVEAWSRKLPIVCSDMPPYNVDGKHMHNCILIPNTKNYMPNKHVDRDWAKALKRLILEPEFRQQLGNQLYEDFKVKYHLDHVTKNRAEFYESIVVKAVVTA